VTVVRFNWPKYVGAVVLAVVAWRVPPAATPAPVHVALLAGAAAGVGWAVSSLLATWWVYDHADVYRRVPADLGAVGEWCSVHTGFDEATPVLTAVVGGAPATIVALAVPGRASIRRARAGGGAPSDGLAGTCAVLPVATGSCDTAFLTFAVHEVRVPENQRTLFAELHRVVRPGGRLVVTEHVRDAANAAVFGPGALHFGSAWRWRALAARAGFDCGSETKITPYVRRFVWER
jgi:SAM-dependent methyltransferase